MKKLLAEMFSTRVLELIVCSLSVMLFLKGVGAYYGFDVLAAFAAQ